LGLGYGQKESFMVNMKLSTFSGVSVTCCPPHLLLALNDYFCPMRQMKWTSILLACCLVAACFFPWVTVESKQLTITGFHTEGTNFGKPGVLYAFFCFFYVAFILIGRAWSIRVAFLVNAFNVAWAIRNFIVLSTCSGGECPVKHVALYLILAISIVMLLTALLVKPVSPNS
jgi:hypothetical protein